MGGCGSAGKGKSDLGVRRCAQPGGTSKGCPGPSCGVGIAQWTEDERWQGLLAFARDKHVSPYSVRLQAEIYLMRFPVLAIAFVVAALVVIPAQAASSRRVCGLIYARVPSSADPHGGKPWRVYVSGMASCHTAERTLNAVMHLHGTNHFNGYESNSYVTYRGWTCPYGQMGSQVCFLGSTRRPRARALARNCTTVKCPATKAPSF